MKTKRSARKVNLHHHHLESFRKIADYPEIGALRALDFCVEHSIPTPEWVAVAIRDLTFNLLRSEKGKRKGRHGNCVARLREALYDIDRWNAVEQVREIRAKHASDERVCQEFYPDGNVPATWAVHRTRRGEWLKDGTYACAAKYLQGRNSYASPRTMKASHQKVERQMKGGSVHLAGIWLTDSFLWQLGLEGWHDMKPGHKKLLFY